MKNRGETELSDAVRLYRKLPGISELLARRISTQLDVQTLEELELAAHDGRLKKVKGFGTQRVKTIKDILASGLIEARHAEKEMC
jgi:hypothetical protein